MQGFWLYSETTYVGKGKEKQLMMAANILCHTSPLNPAPHPSSLASRPPVLQLCQILPLIPSQARASAAAPLPRSHPKMIREEAEEMRI